MVDFKPSEVFVNTVPPLTGTMEHAECEHAAAILVDALAVKGDTWREITIRDLGVFLDEALKAGREPWKSLNRNPFFRPVFQDLVSKGFAVESGLSGHPSFSVAFTDKGIEAMRKWVRRTGT